MSQATMGSRVVRMASDCPATRVHFTLGATWLFTTPKAKAFGYKKLEAP